MVRHDQEGTARGDALSSLDVDAAGRVGDDPGRAAADARFAEHPVISREATSRRARHRSDEATHDLDACATSLADERFGALAGNDPGELTSLRVDLTHR